MPAEHAADARIAPRPIVEDEHLRAVKRRFVLGLNLVSLAGSALALQRALTGGIGGLELALFAAMYALTGFGITVGYHRYFAHRSFETGPFVRALLAASGSMAGHGPVVSWTATHRCHHRYADAEGDPHSPRPGAAGLRGRLRGLWHAHMGWLLEGHLANSMVFAKDLCRDPLVARTNRHYVPWVLVGFALPAAAGGVLGGSADAALSGLLWGGAVRFLVSFHATCSVNSITHAFGRRPFETVDGSTNLGLLALATFGEGWHNNHHAFPASARLGLRWWQLDPGWAVVRVLEWTGLAWGVKRPRTVR